MKWIVFAMLTASSMFASAQLVGGGGAVPFSWTPTISGTLLCGQYQHVYHWPGPCGPALCVMGNVFSSCSATCSPVPPDRCEDDMHEVTEREWQKLTARLKELEESKAHSPLYIFDTDGKSRTVWGMSITSGSERMCALEIGPHMVANFSALITDDK